MAPGIVSFIPSRWGVGVSLAILVAAGVLKWNAGLMPEHVSIPSPMLPSPNAWDIYNRAGALLTAEALDRKSGTSFATDSLSVAKERRLVAENLPALALLREGLRARYVQPPARSVDTVFAYFQPDRALARLLSVQGELAATDGDWNGAMNDALDAVQLGASVEHGATLIGGLVGSACEETGRKMAWGYVDHLSAAQAKADARRLSGIAQDAVPFSQVLREEQWEAQAEILEIYRKQDAFADDSDSPFAARLVLRLEAPRVAYDNYTRYTDEEIRRAALPWPTQKTLRPQPLPGDPLNRIMLPMFMGASALLSDNAALNNLLITKVALRAYRLEHGGAYPAELSRLVPAYLPSVPLDPFSGGQALRYRLVNGKPLVYSVGPDAVDNGGKPVAQTADDKYPRDSDAGDIVAGNG